MTNNNRIEMQSVGELKGHDFFIPRYQRGYRWAEQQIKDLLDDIYSYYGLRKEKGIYCLQPLVVKRKARNVATFVSGLVNQLNANADDAQKCIEDFESYIQQNSQWEVIDGQQRLTSLYIILRVIDEHMGISNPSPIYNIEYETRKGSAEYLLHNLADSQKAEENIDYDHMHKAYTAANLWFKQHGGADVAKFMRKQIVELVNFIWYESVSEDPIKVFTRLNIGKIALTNAELIKAMLLNRTNYKSSDSEHLHLLQLDIAKKWDEIEYSLQNDELWYFLSDDKKTYDTRIDFIFEMISSQNLLNLSDKELKDVGNDRYSSYRYLAAWVERKATTSENANGTKADEPQSVMERITMAWSKVTGVFDTFREWFDDMAFYHYIGFLISETEMEHGDKFKLLCTLLKEWPKKNKQAYLDYIKKRIKDSINCENTELNKLHFEEHKAKIRKILLLHNIQTIIDGHNTQQESKYKLQAFYKFPFHLFKKETWNVEHIDSATSNELSALKEKKAWARTVIDDKALKDDVSSRLNQLLNSSKADDEWFKKLYDDAMQAVGTKNMLKVGEDGEDNERMHIWNLTLLDEHTNKSYHNYIFSVKRSFVIFKEKGYKSHLNDSGVAEPKERGYAFVPPCTKQVFMKYYTTESNDLLSWNKTDAENYLTDIETKLKEFLQ